MALSPTKTLNNGKEIPIVGLGTYTSSRNKGACKKACIDALRHGYRHIDTASFYANEEEIGEALGIVLAEGFVKREELFITTKLWNDEHRQEQVLPALNRSLKKLGLDYVDLYLIHWPISVNNSGNDAKIDLLETWKGMEDVYQKGLAKSIGFSNFNEAQIDKICTQGTIKPVCNQIELHPRLSYLDLVKHCTDRDIAVVAYCPLGTVPDAKRSKGKDILTPDDPTLMALTAKYKKTTAQVILGFLVQRGAIIIPKSYTESRIKENIDIFDIHLTDSEMEEMLKLNRDDRCVNVDFWKKFSNYPF